MVAYFVLVAVATVVVPALWERKRHAVANNCAMLLRGEDGRRANDLGGVEDDTVVSQANALHNV